MSTVTTNNEVAILSRVIRPERDDLSEDAAQSILALDFEPEDQERMNALAQKSQQGSLSDSEQQELQSYVNVGHLLALLQSKARVALKKLGTPS